MYIMTNIMYIMYETEFPLGPCYVTLLYLKLISHAYATTFSRMV